MLVVRLRLMHSPSRVMRTIPYANDPGWGNIIARYLDRGQLVVTIRTAKGEELFSTTGLTTTGMV